MQVVVIRRNFKHMIDHMNCHILCHISEMYLEMVKSKLIRFLNYCEVKKTFEGKTLLVQDFVEQGSYSMFLSL